MCFLTEVLGSVKMTEIPLGGRYLWGRLAGLCTRYMYARAREDPTSIGAAGELRPPIAPTRIVAGPGNGGPSHRTRERSAAEGIRGSRGPGERDDAVVSAVDDGRHASSCVGRVMPSRQGREGAWRQGRESSDSPERAVVPRGEVGVDLWLRRLERKHLRTAIERRPRNCCR